MAPLPGTNCVTKDLGLVSSLKHFYLLLLIFIFVFSLAFSGV